MRKPCNCTLTVYQKIVSLNKIDATEADTTIPQSFNVSDYIHICSRRTLLVAHILIFFYLSQRMSPREEPVPQSTVQLSV